LDNKVYLIFQIDGDLKVNELDGMPTSGFVTKGFNEKGYVKFDKSKTFSNGLDMNRTFSLLSGDWSAQHLSLTGMVNDIDINNWPTDTVLKNRRNFLLFFFLIEIF